MVMDHRRKSKHQLGFVLILVMVLLLVTGMLMTQVYLSLSILKNH